jgi:hypothetical protein
MSIAAPAKWFLANISHNAVLCTTAPHEALIGTCLINVSFPATLCSWQTGFLHMQHYHVAHIAQIRQVVPLLSVVCRARLRVLNIIEKYFNAKVFCENAQLVADMAVANKAQLLAARSHMRTNAKFVPHGYGAS